MIYDLLLSVFVVAAVVARSLLVASQIKINVVVFFSLKIIVFDYYTIRAATIRCQISCCIQNSLKYVCVFVQLAETPRIA